MKKFLNHWHAPFTGLVLFTLLTACATRTLNETVFRDIPVTINIPSEVRRCAGTPEVPGAGANMPAINTYIIDLHAAHSECYRNLNTFNEILLNFEAEIDRRQREARGAAETPH